MDGQIKRTVPKSEKWSNWAGNITCYANHIFRPHTEEELQKIVLQAKQEKKKIRVVGSGHS
ncbi:MAG: hypothetical protein MK212_21095, partial [Saprospiraceae bacterium]|nr:hypothetical protein [Saprospiraceae bacterium]